MKVSDSLVSHLWDKEKNHISPEDITTGSHKKVWWLCKIGHSHSLPISSKVRRPDGCSVCSGREILPGYNDLATTHPEIVLLWDWDLNVLTPEEVSVGRREKFYWVCEKQHSWVNTPSGLTRGRGCPYCSGQKTLAGFNDLASQVPDSVVYWDYEANHERPETISKGSHKKFYWVCEKQHSWLASAEKFARGTRCPYCSNRKVDSKNNLATLHPQLDKEWSFENDRTSEQVSPGSEYYATWVCSVCAKSWTNYVFNRTRTSFLGGSGCPHCAAGKQTSKAEQQIADFVKNILPKSDIRTSVRTLIPGELDIYIPDKNIAIEFNGVYWHSEAHVDKNYHYNKWKACKEKGIQLIQIWEDDWNRNPELVKRMLAHKLEATQQSTIYARKTKVRLVPKDEMVNFLNTNHIQGAAAGSVRLGLFDEKDSLVAVMLFKQKNLSDKSFILSRFATSQKVVGGFTKLLKYFENNYNAENIISFSDNTVSTGDLYCKSGFKIDKILPPNYSYLVKNGRKHKFGYRLKRFRDDPALQYEEGLSERELAQLNNLHRVWDAGKIRWVKQLHLKSFNINSIK